MTLFKVFKIIQVKKNLEATHDTNLADLKKDLESEDWKPILIWVHNY